MEKKKSTVLKNNVSFVNSISKINGALNANVQFVWIQQKLKKNQKAVCEIIT